MQLAYSFSTTGNSSRGPTMTKRKKKLKIVIVKLIKNFLLYDIFEVVIIQKTSHNR